MSRSVKFAISIPDKEFKELEAFRKKRGVSRSKLILEAIKLWKEAKERERLVRIYEEGYKRAPENLRNIEAWEKASLSVFSQEEW
jgi:hypothetical protein